MVTGLGAPSSSSGGGGATGFPSMLIPLRPVGGRSEQGSTQGTIAINRIYFVQLLPTYTRPRGLPNWVSELEGWPLAWRLKSVDRHTQGCGLTAAEPGCPLRGSGGGHKGETCNSKPAETPWPGVSRTWDGRGEAGCWLKSQEGPLPTPGGHLAVIWRQWTGHRQILVELEGPGGATGNSQLPAPQPTWGSRAPRSRVGGWEAPGRTIPHSVAGAWNHSL